LLERSCLNALLRFYGEEHLVERAEDLIDFSDLRLNPFRIAYKPSVHEPYLVFEIYGRIEVGNLGVDRLAEHLAFACVDERAHLCNKMSGFRVME
jgi:hypothetical protein